MKKIIIFLLPFMLFSCFGESNEVKQAKEKLLNNSGSQNSQVEENSNEKSDVEQKQEIQKSYYKINYLTGDKLIGIEEIKNIESINDTLDINGIIENNEIDKVKISFENQTSKFPTDNYILKTFKKGDKKFLYRAYKKYQVLDYGLNKYTIKSYIGENEVSILELEVFIANNENIKNQEEKTENDSVPKTVGSENDNVFLNLPVNENLYGKPVMTGDSSFTYSNISDFEVTKTQEISEVTCENIGDFLKNNYTWYYYNTCRPIYEDSFSVNVLTLIGDKYKYERFYIDKKYNFFAKLLLETGEGLKQEDMISKNDELKLKKFDVVDKTDKLFLDMLK